jgi:membrane associated rhomboid family serine protease
MGSREYVAKKMPLLGQDNNQLILLIAINTIVFILLNFLRIVYALSYDDNSIAETFFQSQILDWFQLPTSLNKLATRPWTLVTCMFTHYRVMHLIGSMLWLWGFGFILQDLAGNSKLMPVYLYGGATGSLFFLLAIHFFPFLYNHIASIAPFLGSGAAVMAVAVATTTLTPEYRIFPLINGGIPLWVLTIIFVAFDFVSVAGENGGASVAHIAGGAIGFIFVKQLHKGNDWSKWMTDFVNWINDLFNPEKKYTLTKRDTLFYKTDKPPYQKTTNVTQQKLDAILDKINQHGFEMLSKEEKDFLNRAKDEL